jgi:hypothetical protein
MCKMFIIKCVLFQMRWVGHVARKGERCMLGFSGETEGKRPIGGPRYRWEDNIKGGSLGSGIWGAWTGLIWLRIGTGGGHL